MYQIATRSKALLAATSVVLTLGFSSAAAAGPGKPGINDIDEGGNIVEVAIAANNALDVFNTVLAAAQCEYFEGAVVAILTGEDKVTLFAPIDPAFAALGLDAGNVCAKFNGDMDSMGTPEDLLEILAYHVTDGRRFSNSVFNANNSKMIEMLTGDYIVSFVDATDGPMLHDGAGQMISIVAEAAAIKTFDINALNGVIHTVDTVLLPTAP